jgi:hypothetical protein
MGQQFEELPEWEFAVRTNTTGTTYTVVATRSGGVRGDASGEDIDDLLRTMRRWATATATEVGLLVRRALSEVEELMQAAFERTGESGIEGTALDQAGLADGGVIVIDYLAHNEAGLALDHLLYMIIEPSLPVSGEAKRDVLRAANLIGDGGLVARVRTRLG